MPQSHRRPRAVFFYEPSAGYYHAPSNRRESGVDALMPSFTGANYGLMFSAWGLCGFIVPGYFAGIMDQARLAGDLASGYREVYWKLALLATVGAVVTAFLRPRQASSRGAQN